MSRLITSPNPGTNSLPFGTSILPPDSDFVSFCSEVLADDCALTSVFVSTFVSTFTSTFVSVVEDVLVSVVVVTVGIDTLSIGAVTGSGCMTGAGVGNDITDVGLTGLVTFSTFVSSCLHELPVSAHSPKIGSPYGSGQVELCWRVIAPV